MLICNLFIYYPIWSILTLFVLCFYTVYVYWYHMRNFASRFNEYIFGFELDGLEMKSFITLQVKWCVLCRGCSSETHWQRLCLWVWCVYRVCAGTICHFLLLSVRWGPFVWLCVSPCTYTQVFVCVCVRVRVLAASRPDTCNSGSSLGSEKD